MCEQYREMIMKWCKFILFHYYFSILLTHLLKLMLPAAILGQGHHHLPAALLFVWLLFIIIIIIHLTDVLKGIAIQCAVKPLSSTHCFQVNAVAFAVVIIILLFSISLLLEISLACAMRCLNWFTIWSTGVRSSSTLRFTVFCYYYSCNNNNNNNDNFISITL